MYFLLYLCSISSSHTCPCSEVFAGPVSSCSFLHLKTQSMRQVKVVCLFAALLMLAANARSQDYQSTNPKMVKVLGDTLHSKMMLVTFMPGETTTVHSHPVHIIYALNSGTLRVAHVNGSTETLHIRAGQSATFPAEAAHKTTNTGKTPLKLILLEISQ